MMSGEVLLLKQGSHNNVYPMLNQLPPAILVKIAIYLPDACESSSTLSRSIFDVVYSAYPNVSCELLVFEKEYQSAITQGRPFVERGPFHAHTISSDTVSAAFPLMCNISSLLLVSPTVNKKLTHNPWFHSFWVHMWYVVLSRREAIRWNENQEELEELEREKNRTTGDGVLEHG